MARRERLKHGLPVRGEIRLVCRNRDGSIAWKERVQNAAVTVGLNYVLDVAFRGQSQLSSWYCGLIDGASTPTLSSADTMSSHSGWSENTSYSESTRRQWSPSAAASGAVSNASAFSFTANASATIYGLFFASNSTKSGTSGTLWATAPLSVPRALVNGQALYVTYTVSLGAA